jgi:hypothetical protein
MKRHHNRGFASASDDSSLSSAPVLLQRMSRVSNYQYCTLKVQITGVRSRFSGFPRIYLAVRDARLPYVFHR